MIKISFCNVSREDQLNLTREPRGAARLENRSGVMEGLRSGATGVGAQTPWGRERKGKEWRGRGRRRRVFSLGKERHRVASTLDTKSQQTHISDNERQSVEWANGVIFS